ncbi:unnamed protein product [Dracunculus medinensis]|uniref:ShKT domain-containing protein n=1 Tax=Dracunculus medinensis TaxID=318479 RepID=A0A0N4URW4_DRAME|nr:unnamed protein product [Dracunculus medinensis]
MDAEGWWRFVPTAMSEGYAKKHVSQETALQIKQVDYIHFIIQLLSKAERIKNFLEIVKSNIVAVPPAGSCRDEHADCPKYRNLCNIGDYATHMRVKCRMTCSLC